jgi:hypothetical protein
MKLVYNYIQMLEKVDLTYIMQNPKTMRKCGLILETGCAKSQDPNWMHTVSKTLCLKSQDVGSNPTTRKIVFGLSHNKSLILNEIALEMI